VRVALADFRRWIFAAAAVAIIGSGLAFVFDAAGAFGSDLWRPVAIGAIWLVLGIAESRLLFSRRWQRMLWCGASMLTGATWGVAGPVWDPRFVWWFVIPAGLEMGCCWKTHRHAWGWFAGTTISYGLMAWWVIAIDHWTTGMVNFVQFLLPRLPKISDELPAAAATLMAILVFRGGIACFLCRPRLTVPCVPGHESIQ
jgi:hypothetical protein